MKASTYIIIPVHNRKQITLNCLKNLEDCGVLQKYHIVVVDDGSTDGTSEAIRNDYPSTEILQGDGNLWWTGAIVLGMKYAYKQGAKYCIWLNDDLQLSKGTIENLLNYINTNNNTIIGCQGVELEDMTSIVFGGKRKTWKGYQLIQAPINDVISCDLLSGNVVCLPLSVIDKIGYPDIKNTPHYGGDSLYLIRAKKAGFSIYVDGRSLVYSVPSESPLYPQKWLLKKGGPLDIIRLVFVPQSGLSWRVWMKLNWEAFRFWGVIMFLKKYISILLITVLRFIPFEIREKLFSKDKTW